MTRTPVLPQEHFQAFVLASGNLGSDELEIVQTLSRFPEHQVLERTLDSRIVQLTSIEQRVDFPSVWKSMCVNSYFLFSLIQHLPYSLPNTSLFLIRSVFSLASLYTQANSIVEMSRPTPLKNTYQEYIFIIIIAIVVKTVHVMSKGHQVYDIHHRRYDIITINITVNVIVISSKSPWRLHHRRFLIIIDIVVINMCKARILRKDEKKSSGMEKLVTRGSVQQLGMTSYDDSPLVAACRSRDTSLGVLQTTLGRSWWNGADAAFLGLKVCCTRNNSSRFCVIFIRGKCLQPRYDFRFSCRACHDLLTDFSGQDSQFAGSEIYYLARITQQVLHPGRARLTRSLFLANMSTVIPGSAIWKTQDWHCQCTHAPVWWLIRKNIFNEWFAFALSDRFDRDDFFTCFPSKRQYWRDAYRFRD